MYAKLVTESLPVSSPVSLHGPANGYCPIMNS